MWHKTRCIAHDTKFVSVCNNGNHGYIKKATGARASKATIINSSYQHVLRTLCAFSLSSRLISDLLIELLAPYARLLAEICSMEATSTECLWEVRSLLTCPPKVAAARSLEGNEAQEFVDFLDRVSEP